MKKTMSARCLPAAAVAALALFGSAGALAYSSVVVFGDSLSDSGNNAMILGTDPGQVIANNQYIPTLPYAQGSYTDANVWVNSFAVGLGVPSGAVPSQQAGGNYAFGAARTVVNGAGTGGFPFSATTQLGMYLMGNPAINADSLFVVAIGGNDVRTTIEAAQADPGNAGAIIGAGVTAFAAGVDAIVDSLQAAGAANPNIVVWTAPDVGKTPFAIAAGGAAGAAAATAISANFNLALSGALADDVALGVKVFDIFTIVNGVVAAPAAFGLSNVTDACGALGAACDPATYLFWDGIHPTSAGHALIAGAMLQVVAVPEPGSVLMMAVGLAGLLFVHRRRARISTGLRSNSSCQRW